MRGGDGEEVSGDLVGYWFGGDAEPGVVCEVDGVIVIVCEDGVALLVVPEEC